MEKSNFMHRLFSSCSSTSVFLPCITSDPHILSFRGEDTRKSFTGHLLAALQRKGIYTFKDDIRLQRGDPIAPELLRAIEQSRIFIVVFSKNYADSTWCLEELAKICEEVISEQGYTVFPIFYDVDPSDVRKQNGTFKDAFDKHERDFSDNLEKVQRWRNILTQVGCRTGWDLRTKSEPKVIDEIVEKATRKLGHKFSEEALQLHCRRASRRDDPWSNFRRMIHSVLQAVRLFVIALFSRFSFFVWGTVFVVFFLEFDIYLNRAVKLRKWNLRWL